MLTVLARLLRNTVSNAGLTLLTLLLALFATPVLVHGLGEEGFGLLLLASSVIGYFNLLGLGVPGGVVKHVATAAAADDPDAVEAIIGTTFYLYSAIGLLSCAAVVASVSGGLLDLVRISDRNREAAAELLYFAAIWSVFSWPARVLSDALRGLQAFHRINVVDGAVRIVTIAISVLLVWGGAPLLWVFIGQQTPAVFLWVGSLYLLRKEVPGVRFSRLRFHAPVARSLFSFSIWLFVGGLASTLLYQTDRLILAAFLPVSAITIYHIVLKPFDLIKTAAAIQRSAVMPAVAEVQQRFGLRSVDRFVYELPRYDNALVAPLCLIGALLSGPFIRLWMGPEYGEYVWIAQAACVFQFTWQSTGMLGEVVKGLGEARTPALIALSAAIVNVGASIWGVSVWGLGGVVFGTMVAGAIIVPLQFWLVFPRVGVKRMRYFWAAIVKGQLPSWALGSLLLPVWSRLQDIESWIGLIVTMGSLLVIAHVLNWAFLASDRKALLKSILSSRFRDAPARA